MKCVRIGKSEWYYGTPTTDDGWEYYAGEWRTDDRVWRANEGGKAIVCSQCKQVAPVIAVSYDDPYSSTEYRLCAACLALAISDLATLPERYEALAVLETAEDSEDDKEE